MPALMTAENVSNVVVVSFTGSVMDAECEDRLIRQFHGMKLAEQQYVIIDLSGVPVLPSSVIAAIITLHKRIGGRLALCCAGVHLLEQMTVTQLIRIFTIYADRTEALTKMA